VGTTLKKHNYIGVRISKSPSKSTTSRVHLPQRRIVKSCSLLVLYKSMHPPSRFFAHTLSHNLSRTSADRFPIKTPALGSNIHLVIWPLKEVGTFSRIITTIWLTISHHAIIHTTLRQLVFIVP